MKSERDKFLCSCSRLVLTQTPRCIVQTFDTGLTHAFHRTQNRVWRIGIPPVGRDTRPGPFRSGILAPQYSDIMLFLVGCRAWHVPSADAMTCAPLQYISGMHRLAVVAMQQLHDRGSCGTGATCCLHDCSDRCSFNACSVDIRKGASFCQLQVEYT